MRLKFVLVIFASIFLQSCTINHGLPVGTHIESYEDCFVKTKREFVRVECQPGYVEPWFYEHRHPAMTDAEKVATLVKFREAQLQLDEEEIAALQESLRDIAKCSPEEKRSECSDRVFNNPLYKERHEIIRKHKAWIYKDIYNKVIIHYQNEAGYPEYPERVKFSNGLNDDNSLIFKEDTSIEFEKKVIDAILKDFVGVDYKKYFAELSFVTNIVYIVVYVKSDDEFESLLMDPRITFVEHIGNPREIEEIVSTNYK